MISKERLEELIKEDAKIYFYSNDYGIIGGYKFHIEEFNLKGCELYHDFDSTQLVYENELYDLKDLFETKSEAEFDAEFSNIEKVVKMPVPPTWEEFKKLKIFEIRTIYAEYELELYENTKQLVLTGDYVGTKYSRLMLSYLSTEENYIKALRKMVELFKEEG